MRAVLCGYYGMGNGGDEALLASLLQMLPARVTPIVLSGNPQETSDRYQVEAIPRKSFGHVLSALKRSDAFIWGGGSLMQDASSLANPLYYGGLMMLAQLMGLKTIAWAQGIGPLDHPLSRLITRTALKNCQGLSVRDRPSEALLDRWQLNCLLAPDPVWALESAPVPGLSDLPAPRVAVALRPHKHLSEHQIKILAQALASFQKATGVCLLLVAFQPVKDRAIAQTLSDHLTTQNSGPHHIYCIEQPQQLKGLFRGVEMTIGMRFHALVMSAAESCRSFAISYDPKVDAIAHDLALPGWTLAPSPPAITQGKHSAGLPPLPHDPQAICQTWLDFYVNGEALNPAQIQSQVDRALMHRDLLSETLFPNG